MSFSLEQVASIGSNVTERLVELGADVRALVHYIALGSRGWLDQLSVHDKIFSFR